MALRILVYVGLLYLDSVRDNKLTPDGRLPPVLPVVLYSGEDAWTAATEIAALIESVPGGLERYRPQMRYSLVEERGFSDAELAPMRNLVAALFRLENSRGPEDLVQVLGSKNHVGRTSQRLEKRGQDASLVKFGACHLFTSVDRWLHQTEWGIDWNRGEASPPRCETVVRAFGKPPVLVSKIVNFFTKLATNWSGPTPAER